MFKCPCCDDRLLHHIRKGSQYWFCRSCWQEMPLFDSEKQEVDRLTASRVLTTQNLLEVPVHSR